MKKSIGLMVVFTLVSLMSVGQSSEKKKETFKVYGNCGMCEKTIEGALNGKSGIYKADWNKDSKKMSVSYDPSKITLDQVKQRIADAGYDTDSHRAKKEKYEGLHGCCQYERPK